MSTTPDSGARASFKETVQRVARAALDPVTGAFAAAGVKPDHLTVLGLLLSMAAGIGFALGHFRTASLVAIAAGICDILDGQLARRLGRVSRFGAFFDSTLDRIAEAFLLLGIAGFYTMTLVDLTVDPERVARQLARGLEPITWAAVAFLAMLALVGSFMVSYTRARAEGLGLDGKVGWFERPERMVLLIIAGLAGIQVMPVALLLLATLSFATAFQRMAHVWKQTRAAGRDT